MKTVVYFIGEYPKLANAFVQTQVLELKRRGFRVIMCSLNEPAKAVGPDDYKADGVIYMKKDFTPLKMLKAHGLALLTHPLRYLGITGDVILGRIPWKIFAMYLWVWPEVKRIAPDYMHCYFAEGQAQVGMMVARLLHIPYTFQIGGTGNMLKKPKELKCMVDHVSRTVVVSRDMEEKIFKLAPALAKHKVVFNTAGIDMKRFKVQTQSNREANSVLFVGRQVKHKGVHFLIESLGRLKKEGCVFRAKIIGDGVDLDEFKRLAQQLDLEGCVQFLGAVPNEQIPEYMRSAGIFAFPSTFEGTPIVLMEAMACGCAIVSTRVNGIPDMITDGENGYLIEPKDVDALTDRLRKLFNDPDKVMAMSRAAIERSRQYDIVFQMGSLVKEWENIQR